MQFCSLATYHSVNNLGHKDDLGGVTLVLPHPYLFCSAFAVHNLFGFELTLSLDFMYYR